MNGVGTATERTLGRVEDAIVKNLRRLQGARLRVRVGVAACVTSAALGIHILSGPGATAMLEYAIVASLAAWLFGARAALGVVAVVAGASAVIRVALWDAGHSWQLWANTVLRAATLVLMVVVVDALRRHIDRAELAAELDPLTGSRSRRALLGGLDDAVSAAHRERSPLTVLYLDLDDLKSVNDLEGHAAGDAVIQHFVEVVMRHCRRADVLGRVGGDEFLLICRDTDVADAQRLVDRVLADPDLPSASIGIAALEPGATATQLLNEADAAMYRAKRR